MCTLELARGGVPRFRLENGVVPEKGFAQLSLLVQAKRAVKFGGEHDGQVKAENPLGAEMGSRATMTGGHERTSVGGKGTVGSTNRHFQQAWSLSGNATHVKTRRPTRMENSTERIYHLAHRSTS